MNKVIDVLIGIAQTGVLGVVAAAVIGWLKSHTKNENLAMFYDWINQGIAIAEKTWGPGQGSAKQQDALKFVKQRIDANGLTGHFSDSQIEGAIEQELKANKGVDNNG